MNLRGKKEKAPAIKYAVSIDERPEIVDNRQRFNNWEIDTVLGKHETVAIITILERKTHFHLTQEYPQSQLKLPQKRP
ncbi:hypothetical protein VIN01S_13280 [Vibrio inusitatus NBRC 102082]|uniref:Transposase n=1 Tax=Vibrio inusitatus NBRC 102082 TaxID=1219070 RepID=A0A4Y3HW83_9VIBR|nr:hypothetical protein VIN01S_13280 [Vibrio inusitatus NBRC 102082]